MYLNIGTKFNTFFSHSVKNQIFLIKPHHFKILASHSRFYLVKIQFPFVPNSHASFFNALSNCYDFFSSLSSQTVHQNAIVTNAELCGWGFLSFSQKKNWFVSLCVCVFSTFQRWVIDLFFSENSKKNRVKQPFLAWIITNITVCAACARNGFLSLSLYLFFSFLYLQRPIFRWTYRKRVKKKNERNCCQNENCNSFNIIIQQKHV